MDKYFFAGVTGLILVTVSISLVATNSGDSFTGQEKAAVISLDGAITSTSDSFNPQTVTPERVRELNSKAQDRGASVIIYEWNSGGGAVVASKEIRREIESLDMTTICRFRDVAASGAYLASLGCDRIVADSASLTGSIGVKSSYIEFSGLMNELGVEYVNITSGSLKDAGSPYKNITDKERKVLQEKTDIIHEEFVKSVEDERNLTEEQVEEVRTGEIFLGSQGKELGLVDTIGGRETAVKEAEEITDTKLQTEKVEIESSFGILSLLNANTNLASLLGNSNPLEAAWR